MANIAVKKVSEINPADYKPKDRLDGYPLQIPKWYRRVLETIPGLLTWFLILLPVFAAIFEIPQIIVAYVAFLTMYWTFRGFRFAYGIILGYKRYKDDIARDWVGEIKELKKPIPEYVFIFPIVKEGLDVLDPTMESFANQDIGSERIHIVFALEENFTDVSVPLCEELMAKYKDRFAEMYIEVHPFGIDGEVVGVKGGNINWATRNFYKKVQKRGEVPENYLLITCDSDMRVHPKYLSSITYKYLTVDNPLNKYYCTAVHTFNNNIWRVPPLNRIFGHSLTFAIWHSWVLYPHLRETWSAYVINLETVHKVEYWDPAVGIDDTPFYWNARLRLKNDFKGVEVYVPTYNDAVENQDFYNSHKALYKQQLRWGWGIIVFPLTVANFYKNPELNLYQKSSILWKLIHNQLLFLTVVYTITFAVPILHLISSEYKFSAASKNLTDIMRIILTSLMFLNIPIYLIRSKITPKPTNWKWWRHILDFFEILLITVNMLTFGFIPKIHAQTLMLMNRFTKKHYVTDKVAIK